MNSLASARHYRVAGIDPGALSGLVCLQVPAVSDDSLTGARWIGSTHITSGTHGHRTAAENDARLFTRIREQLVMWRVQHVTLEEPKDAVPSWGGGGKSAAGTLFALGRAYGLALAAAASLNLSVISYPVTSRKAVPEKRKRERLGWMPTQPGKNGGIGRVLPREQTLALLDALSRDLRMRPADGVMLAPHKRLLPLLSEDELMALGVLRFHLSRLPLRAVAV